MAIVDPWTVLAAMAQATTSIRIGPMVTPLARRRPWVVARQAATVSRLSGGRLILGTGLGSDESGDFSRFGEPDDPGTRAGRYDEGLDIVAAIWSGRAYRHQGRHYQLNLDAGSALAQHVPVWVASSTGHPKVIARAARQDDIFPNPADHTPTPDEIAELLTRLHRAGLPPERPFDVAVAGNASPAW